VKGYVESVREGRKVCVILSSMIHELYAYSPLEIDTFWNSIWDIKAEYIAIRDMCVSRACSRPSDPTLAARIYQRFDPSKIAQWEARWGSLSDNWSMVNFLLHYRYLDNWEREYKENYLPICKEDLLHLVIDSYCPIHIEHYVLPFIRAEVQKTFGIQLQDATHIKLILQRRC